MRKKMDIGLPDIARRLKGAALPGVDWNVGIAAKSQVETPNDLGMMLGWTGQYLLMAATVGIRPLRLCWLPG